MKMTQLFTTALAGCLITVALAGCAGGGNNDNNSSKNTNQSASSEKVKLTALVVKHSLTKDVNTMQWLNDLQDSVGVEIEWQQISADWDQKKSVLFASGEIPDLLFNATTDADYVQYQGLFEDLSPLINESATNISQMFNDHPEAKVLAETIDGKIYGVPRYRSVWPDTSPTMFINKTWLDNLGLELPTTWDELEDVLIAFRDGDPNQNGDTTDEIPMDFDKITSSYSPRLLLGSLGLPLSNYTQNGYFVEDGIVKNFLIDDRFKTLMIYLQKLYKEGLINQEVITQDYSKYQSLARGDGNIAKVGFTWGWESGDRFGNELRSQYVALPQLKQHSDSTHELYWSYDHYQIGYSGNAVAMSSKTKNKEAAMKFIDAMYDEKTSIEVLFGGMNDTDKGIKDNGDGTYQVLPPADAQLDPGTWKWTNSLADMGAFYIRDEMKQKLTLGEDMQRVVEEKSTYDQLLAKADVRINVYPQGFMKYSQEDINILAMNQANINHITDQSWAIWMTDASKDIEAEWNDYVKQVNNVGMKQNLEIRQKAYEAYLAQL
ncbi:sugar ABC transporter substrate-binding protein [Paenibacillus montaniterrae]|uniref:Sugar ABC transporter substrate-binding protein n=1 Tax=Paenibacillus montaniterrae TaxID=429341 RepID=A0A919YSN0_9BACL|nr:extracellular solute-binding protein [Paenibacillus montaniterrae]GIP19348.1 sugar ABC transporter substrate-binding protein [Paenibacillus montaniterrae]